MIAEYLCLFLRPVREKFSDLNRSAVRKRLPTAAVQDMYEGSETVVRCAVGTTEIFIVKVGPHQGSFLFAVIMDRLTNKVRREPPWTMLFADDIVICKETREEVEPRIE